MAWYPDLRACREELTALDAPIYMPAASFEQPTAVPYPLKLENLSVAELMAMPAAWDIVAKHMPVLPMMVGSPAIKPHLGNFTVQSLQVFMKPGTPDAFAAIDQELSLLPPARESAS